MRDEDGQISWRGGREVRRREVTGEFGLCVGGLVGWWVGGYVRSSEPANVRVQQ